MGRLLKYCTIFTVLIFFAMSCSSSKSNIGGAGENPKGDEDRVAGDDSDGKVDLLVDADSFLKTVKRRVFISAGGGKLNGSDHTGVISIGSAVSGTTSGNSYKIKFNK